MEKICHAISNGKVLIVIGMNSMGKTLLTIQLLSKQFADEYLKKQHVRLIYLEFKDKAPPTPTQLYTYWLTETAKALKYSLPTTEVFNDFSFHAYMTDMVKMLKEEERLVFVLLDAQNIRNQGEGFFKSLIYLHRFTYGKVLYILFAEPQLLKPKNIWMQRFIQDATKYQFLFLPLFDTPTIVADIKREEGFLQTTLNSTHHKLIHKYSGGLHGVIGALCYFFKQNPQIATIRQLKDIVFNDQMYQYWIQDIFDSLPFESIQILKEVCISPHAFKKYQKNIFGTWLVSLGFLKRNGTFLHPLMLPIIAEYARKKTDADNQLQYSKHHFYVQREKVKLTKKEHRILEKLYTAKGKVLSYDVIGELLWGKDSDDFSLWAISQIIRRLRKKLTLYGLHPKIISSERGEGYILH